ncbi:MAG: amidohydrolase [Clostridia bacterium]|nr:amidohydrolase [Clostridia bacterium]
MYKILDIHCHIFPEKVALKAAMAIGKFYDAKMNMDGTVGTLIKAGDEAGFTHYLVQSVATTPKQVSHINRFIAGEALKSGGKMTGFGAMHPESADMKADIEELVSLGLKGVKLHPDIQGYKSDDYRMLKIYELCERYGLPVLIHCGDSRYDNSNPNRIAPILDIYENLTVIGAHFGGYTVWEQAAEKLSRYKNFYVDTSSSLFALDKKTAKKLIEIYGVDKVLFGTDYPMWNPKEELDRFIALDLSDEERKKILWDNGAKLLKLN